MARAPARTGQFLSRHKDTIQNGIGTCGTAAGGIEKSWEFLPNDVIPFFYYTNIRNYQEITKNLRIRTDGTSCVKLLKIEPWRVDARKDVAKVLHGRWNDEAMAKVACAILIILRKEDAEPCKSVKGSFDYFADINLRNFDHDLLASEPVYYYTSKEKMKEIKKKNLITFSTKPYGMKYGMKAEHLPALDAAELHHPYGVKVFRFDDPRERRKVAQALYGGCMDEFPQEVMERVDVVIRIHLPMNILVQHKDAPKEIFFYPGDIELNNYEHAYW